MGGIVPSPPSRRQAAPSWTSLRSIRSQSRSSTLSARSSLVSQRTQRVLKLPSPLLVDDGKMDQVACAETTTHESPTTHELPTTFLVATTTPQVMGLEIRSHSFVGQGAFRTKSYGWVVSSLDAKLDKALECIEWYVGCDAKSPHPRLFVGAEFVDVVRDCHRASPLEAVSRAEWTILTQMPPCAVRKTKELDRLGDDVAYIQVRIEGGHRRNVPLVVNVLYKRTVAADHVVLMFRAIAEDDRFPVPKQPTRVKMNGWMLMEPSDDGATHERAFVRFQKETGLSRADWLGTVVQKWMYAEETALKKALHLDLG
ncbi:Aste57867_20036 [Aphanomyces stellatus]|uniref:Aste57867_20036 protein n=1 Tax=Aphanomyces stellatus TaxID=120398 RepID=A0A485LE47_9STRA|nr:hypothetical protein As57867_019970 [Aphanomyces stellatus]VFT96732.1 Aste57867_20036 [Aphanomyces stellatus]